MQDVCCNSIWKHLLGCREDRLHNGKQTFAKVVCRVSIGVGDVLEAKFDWIAPY